MMYPARKSAKNFLGSYRSFSAIDFLFGITRITVAAQSPTLTGVSALGPRTTSVKVHTGSGYRDIYVDTTLVDIAPQGRKIRGYIATDDVGVPAGHYLLHVLYRRRSVWTRSNYTGGSKKRLGFSEMRFGF